LPISKHIFNSIAINHGIIQPTRIKRAWFY
jgi:hypothetical protein